MKTCTPIIFRLSTEITRNESQNFPYISILKNKVKVIKTI